MVCMFVERVKEYCFLFVCWLGFLCVFFTVSGFECLSLNVVPSSVECCFRLVLDCM